jgi:hypothetical protein
MGKNLQLKTSVVKFIDKIKEINRKAGLKPQERIKVSYVASSISFLYEKIRNTVDYKEENLLRKFAIERILNRIIFIEGKRERLGELLLTDLVRGRYFPNDTIGLDRIAPVDEIIHKYLLLLDKADLSKRDEKSAQKLIAWLISIAAFEIDKNLVPYEKEEALAELMYDTVRKNIIIKEDSLSERDVIVQAYLAIVRSIMRADRSILSYYLLKVYWPDWFSEKDWLSVADELGKNIFSVKNVIEGELNHPAGEKFFRFFKRRAVVYLIIFDLLSWRTGEISEKMISDKLAFLEEVRDAANARYIKAREMLSRTFIRSVLYIFITKIALAFVLEVPYELYTDAKVNYRTLGINVIFHPLLLYLIGSSIKAPSQKNTAQIIREAEYAIYQKKSPETPPYVAKFSFSKASGGLFWMFYATMFVISFGAIIYILRSLEFNVVSGALFILFLSVVSFFAFRISQPVRELTVIDKKDNIIDVLSDFFYLPVIHFGRWLSERFSEINVFVFVLDFIIEAPFKSFIKIFDDWVKFLKEKREEMAER